MELPADPRNLVYGIYNKKGERWDEDSEQENKIKEYWQHALSDDDEYDLQRDTPFDMIDYTF